MRSLLKHLSIFFGAMVGSVLVMAIGLTYIIPPPAESQYSSGVYVSEGFAEEDSQFVFYMHWQWEDAVQSVLDSIEAGVLEFTHPTRGPYQMKVTITAHPNSFDNPAGMTAAQWASLKNIAANYPYVEIINGGSDEGARFGKTGIFYNGAFDDTLIWSEFGNSKDTLEAVLGREIRGWAGSHNFGDLHIMNIAARRFGYKYATTVYDMKMSTRGPTNEIVMMTATNGGQFLRHGYSGAVGLPGVSPFLMGRDIAETNSWKEVLELMWNAYSATGRGTILRGIFHNMALSPGDLANDNGAFLDPPGATTSTASVSKLVRYCENLERGLKVAKVISLEESYQKQYRTRYSENSGSLIPMVADWQDSIAWTGGTHGADNVPDLLTSVEANTRWYPTGSGALTGWGPDAGFLRLATSSSATENFKSGQVQQVLGTARRHSVAFLLKPLPMGTWISYTYKARLDTTDAQVFGDGRTGFKPTATDSFNLARCGLVTSVYMLISQVGQGDFNFTGGRATFGTFFNNLSDEGIGNVPLSNTSSKEAWYLTHHPTRTSEMNLVLTNQIDIPPYSTAIPTASWASWAQQVNYFMRDVDDPNSTLPVTRDGTEACAVPQGANGAQWMTVTGRFQVPPGICGIGFTIDQNFYTNTSSGSGLNQNAIDISALQIYVVDKPW